MDTGSTFPDRHGGFDSQYWRRAVAGVNGYPLYGSARAGPSFGFARGKAMHPCFPEKCCDTCHAARTKTDTGGRVQRYQGAREKPR